MPLRPPSPPSTGARGGSQPPDSAHAPSGPARRVFHWQFAPGAVTNKHSEPATGPASTLPRPPPGATDRPRTPREPPTMRPCDLSRTALSACLALLLGAAAAAGRDDTPPRPEDAPALVRKLGDASFRVRDRAFQQLLRLGRAAVPALEAGVNDPDPEVRLRCQRLLPLARRTDLDLRLDAFLSGKDDPKAPPGGWSAFRKLVGGDQAARDLFAL